MKHARFFSVLVFIIAAFYGAVGFYFLPLASYHGDLTRIGMLPEPLFGWTKPQPGIDPALLQQSSWQDAEVLVIGDSFSEPGIWQTVLIGHGLRVRTEHWDHIRDICEDFPNWLRAQGFKGKHVVIEAVERDVRSYFARSLSCKKMAIRHRLVENQPRKPPVIAFDHDTVDLSGKMSVGIKTGFNMFWYNRLSARQDFNIWLRDGVRVARVQQGCDLFSHRSCRDALFLGEDSDQDLGEDIISNMEIIDARLSGLTAIWVIVPNKSTAYLYPDKQFWDRLGQRLRSVNLLKTIRLAIIGKNVDVYPANETHLSTSGYLLMGEEIYRNILRWQDGSTNAGVR